MPWENGPYIVAALICERILEEKDGTASFIRVVDQVNIPVPANLVPVATEEPINIEAALKTVAQLALAINLKSGMNPSEHQLLIQRENGLGTPEPDITIPIVLAGEGRGANIHIALMLAIPLVAPAERVTWFTLRLDNEFLTRIPLRVRIHEAPENADQAAALSAYSP